MTPQGMCSVQVLFNAGHESGYRTHRGMFRQTMTSSVPEANGVATIPFESQRKERLSLDRRRSIRLTPPAYPSIANAVLEPFAKPVNRRGLAATS
jgi:hypothetical protein